MHGLACCPHVVLQLQQQVHAGSALCTGSGMQSAVPGHSHMSAAGREQRTSSWLSTRSSLSAGLLAMCRLTASSTLETGTPSKRAPALTQDPVSGVGEDQAVSLSLQERQLPTSREDQHLAGVVLLLAGSDCLKGGDSDNACQGTYIGTGPYMRIGNSSSGASNIPSMSALYLATALKACKMGSSLQQHTTCQIHCDCRWHLSVTSAYRASRLCLARLDVPWPHDCQRF